MVEIKGIIQYYEQGEKYVDVIVSEGKDVPNSRHRVGVDIKVNRGKIITFLVGIYGISPGEIAWPAHIELKPGGA